MNPLIVWVLLIISGVCLGQHQSNVLNSGGDKQLRLEDIERDNLSGSRKVAQQLPQQQYFAQQQQQLAALQQQFLLQHIQQQPSPAQFYVPQPAYHSVPVIMIPTQTGPFLLPAQESTHFYYQPQQQHQHFFGLPQQQQVLGLHPAIQHPVVQYPQHQALDGRYSTATQKPQQPSQAPFRPSPLLPSPPQRTPAYQQHVPTYNPYNAIYQQQQKFATGVKSTPAPQLKDQQQPTSSQQISNYNFKSIY